MLGHSSRQGQGTVRPVEAAEVTQGCKTHWGSSPADQFSRVNWGPAQTEDRSLQTTQTRASQGKEAGLQNRPEGSEDCPSTTKPLTLVAPELPNCTNIYSKGKSNYNSDYNVYTETSATLGQATANALRQIIELAKKFVWVFP